jgi:hypothetical protein
MSLIEASNKKEYTLSLLFSDGEKSVIDFKPI